MKIIEIISRRGRIWEVRFDDGTYINLDKGYAEPFDLKVGMSISEEKADKMEDESDVLRCKNRAFYYLSKGDLTEKKLREKLIKAGFEQRFVQITLDRLKELSYIDDQSFANRFYEKCRQSGLSSRQSVEKMVAAGISRQKAKEICQYSSPYERESIKRLINKKYRSKICSEDGIKKTTAALIRRGFAFSDIRAVLKEFSDILDGVNEEL